MPLTRRARRAATRSNTKHTILSALDENKPLDTDADYNDDAYNNNASPALPDLDIFKPESIQVLLQDIQRQVKAKQESLSIKGVEINKHQQEVFFVNSMKLEKSVKKMTIGEFNQKFMNGENIILVMKQIMDSATARTNANTNTTGTKKRVRQQNHHHQQPQPQYYLPLETPVRQIKLGIPTRTPGTILRTVRKNEATYSANGSPVNQAEEGDLIATVSKKRRGNGMTGTHSGDGDDNDNDQEGGIGGAMFDISVGDGRTISLSDPSTMEHLTNEMKSTAKNQLNVLQDQLSKLLSRLNWIELNWIDLSQVKSGQGVT